jgi:predicted nucleic acid-binding Zn ribbon protein
VPDRSQPRRNRGCDFSFHHGPLDVANDNGMLRTSPRRVSFFRQPLGVPLPPPGATTMPVYVYETIPQSDADLPLTFELRQSMSEPCLTAHPETGKPVRRVLSGGLATFTGNSAGAAPMRGGGGCGSGCGCAS